MRDDVLACFLHKSAVHAGQVLSVDLGGCVVTNVRQKPSQVSEGGMREQLQELLANAPQNSEWVVHFRQTSQDAPRASAAMCPKKREGLRVHMEL